MPAGFPAAGFFPGLGAVRPFCASEAPPVHNHPGPKASSRNAGVTHLAGSRAGRSLVPGVCCRLSLQDPINPD